MIRGQVNSMGMPIFSSTPSQKFGKIPSFQNSQLINPTQFKQYLPQVNDAQMNWLVSQARQQGISEADITAGLESIKKMR